MVISKKHKLIVITPPKTGTHSIIAYLKNNNIVSDLPINKVNFPIYHLTLSEISYVYDIPTSELTSYKIIQCVRNPYNRIVSAWIHQCSILNKKIEFVELLQNLKIHKQLLKVNDDEFYKSFYKDETHKDKSFRHGNWGGLRFYYEQNWFNDVDANVKYFKLEELHNSTKELDNYIGVSVTSLPILNKNQIGKNELEYDNFYKNKEIMIVTELYENDIKKFNYNFNHSNNYNINKQTKTLM